MDQRDTSNVTGWGRGVLACWRPTTVDEVRACVDRARAERVSLYPLSTGLNWGYGSAAPPQPGAVLLDLSGMNRILNAAEISEANPVAVIEPGVTQRQLHDFLQKNCPGLSFNVTGSAADTSILGNALDRGVGYLGPRREDVYGLEVVTGTGDVLKTGFRRLGEDSPLAQTHPYGLGPMLDGLFFQGNYGIVTSACFRLQLRPQRSVVMSLALRDPGNLAPFLDGLVLLKRLGVLGGVTHVGNRARTRSSMRAGIAEYLSRECGLADSQLASETARILAVTAPYEWTALDGIAGSSAQVRAAVAEVKRVLGGLAKLTVVDDAKLATGYRLLHPLRHVWPWARANAAATSAAWPLHGPVVGRPTDAAVEKLLWRYGAPELAARELDKSRCGLLFISPALPMDGRAAADVVKGMEALAERFGHQLYVTLNVETATSLIAVTNLLFDRSDEAAVAGARHCANELWTYLRSRGLEVYRARADMMEDIVDRNDPFWRTAWALKSVFDPDNIIAPGRYNLSGAGLQGVTSATRPEAGP